MSAPSDPLTDIHLSFTYWRPTAVLFAHGEAFHREPLVYDHAGNFPLSDATENSALAVARAACARWMCVRRFVFF